MRKKRILPPRPDTTTISVVLEASQAQMLRKIADDRMCSISVVAREAVKMYLSVAAQAMLMGNQNRGLTT